MCCGTKIKNLKNIQNFCVAARGASAEIDFKGSDISHPRHGYLPWLYNRAGDPRKVDITVFGNNNETTGRVFKLHRGEHININKNFKCKNIKTREYIKRSNKKDIKTYQEWVSKKYRFNKDKYNLKPESYKFV